MSGMCAIIFRFNAESVCALRPLFFAHTVYAQSETQLLSLRTLVNLFTFSPLSLDSFSLLFREEVNPSEMHSL